MAEKRSATEASESAASAGGYDSTRRNVRDPRFESSSSGVDAGAGGSPAASVCARERVELSSVTHLAPDGSYVALCGYRGIRHGPPGDSMGQPWCVVCVDLAPTAWRLWWRI
jgi:hypothetical protein